MMVKLKKLIQKQNGKWKQILPNTITEDNLSGLIIVTDSGKQFIIKERKNK